MCDIKCVYGSKIYFEQLYNFINNIENRKIKSKFYSFIDLEDRELQMSYASLKKIIEQYMPEKKVIKDKEVKILDRKINEEIKLEDLSSGEFKMIKVLSILNETNANEVLLLDEPELSLSIYWQRELMEALINKNNSLLTIIATQSPDLLIDEEIDYLVPIFNEEDYE